MENNKPVRPTMHKKVDKEAIKDQDKEVVKAQDEEIDLDDFSDLEESIPTKEESIPTKEEIIPTKEESIPTKEESIPTKEESIPTKEESIPTKEERIPTKEEINGIKKKLADVELYLQNKQNNKLITAAEIVVLLTSFILLVLLYIPNMTQHINVASSTDVSNTLASSKSVEQSNIKELNAEANKSSSEVVNNAKEEAGLESSKDSINKIETSDIQYKESTDTSPLNIGEYGILSSKVKTKTKQDEAFVIHDAKAFIKLNNVVTGYNDVKAIVDEYNSNNTENKIVNLPSEEDYSSDGNKAELVILEFNLLYPDDYPTNESSGEVFNIPTSVMSIYGTDKSLDLKANNLEGKAEDYIKSSNGIYRVSDVADLSLSTQYATTNKPVLYKYLTYIPYGTDAKSYEINITLNLAGTKYTYYFNGVSIPEKTNIQSNSSSVSISSNESSSNTVESEN